MLNKYPSDVCVSCAGNAPDHWIADFWLYCAHNRVMVRRRRREDVCTVDRKISPKHAAKHLSRALALMAGYMKANGISPDTVDALLAMNHLGGHAFT